MNILKLLEEHENEIRNKYHVKRIGIFGSYVRGEETEKSDVDILVEFEQSTLSNFMGLNFFLEELLDKKVDLVTTNALSPYLSPKVKKEVVWCEG
jgi:predicted nucleotidyltransferase